MSSVTTGMLYGSYDATTQELSNDVPVCCTPEFLAAYGVGLDSTYGDGVVQGVLREDQAEQAFMGMYSDVYSNVNGQALQELTGEIKNIVLNLDTTNDVSVNDIMRWAVAQNTGSGETPPTEHADSVTALAKVLTDLEDTVSGSPELEAMLGSFFGEGAMNEIDVNGEDRDDMSAGGKLAYIMTRTVLSGYDVADDTDQLLAGDADQNEGTNSTISAEDVEQVGTQPAVSLGEIAQWSIETGAFNSAAVKAGYDNIGVFAQDLFTAVSEGDTAKLEEIGGTNYTPEQLQVLASVMMNNHASLMATGGSYETSGKNGAHEYLNNMNGGDQAFQMLHIGNLGSTGQMSPDDYDGNWDANGAEGNNDLNTTAQRIGDGEEMAIFNAGDNGQGTNGGFDELINNHDDTIGNSASVFEANSTGIQTSATGFVFDEMNQADALSQLNELGAGDPNTSLPPTELTIGGTDVTVSIEDSEDFENEGYDVVIINLKDAEGNVVGSMTATEADDGNGNPLLVEYGDANGDGLVDDVGADGLGIEEFDPDGVSALTYNSDTNNGGTGNSMVDWEATGTPDSLGGLAMNESEDANTGEWTHMYEDTTTTQTESYTEDYDAFDDYNIMDGTGTGGYGGGGGGGTGGAGTTYDLSTFVNDPTMTAADFPAGSQANIVGQAYAELYPSAPIMTDGTDYYYAGAIYDGTTGALVEQIAEDTDTAATAAGLAVGYQYVGGEYYVDTETGTTYTYDDMDEAFVEYTAGGM